MKILAVVLIHRAARPQRCQRLSVLCFGVVVNGRYLVCPITTVTLGLKKNAGRGVRGSRAGAGSFKILAGPVPVC